jgi:hypothetical protein
MELQYSVSPTRGRRTCKPPPARDWAKTVAERLQQQWPTVDPARLDDLALDLWADEHLRALPPIEAADAWLRPVNAGLV